ncbi:hypothetical protein DCMF_00080 [Candidatus Formimonas warabiya]|uniref:GerAB/ArcD/ProY family transporter n=2 Tax=Formimonas warabiya TaxID=1761012 RepID=A0A3G1KLV9_FORW1|nr:hypothetical protein DCMF_00080 [Candidatus Formimonas warabiya]
MKKKEYLSNRQIILLVVFSSISTSVFFVPGEAVTIVFQDIWISILIAVGVTALLGMYPLADMGMRFSGQSIIQYSGKILGKTGGKLMGLLLTFGFFELHTWTLREFSELGIVLLPETPFLIFFLIMSIVVAFAVFHGIEVIGRSAEFVFPLGLMVLILVGIMNISDINFTNLQPVFENHAGKIFNAAQSPLDWLTTGVGFGVLTYYSNQPKGLIKVGLVSSGLSGVILLFFSLLLLCVFGSTILGTANFPMFLLASYGRLGGFEALIITVWFSWIFIRAALYAFVTCVSITHLFELKDFRLIVIPETVLATVYSYQQYKSFMELSYHYSIGHVYYEIFQLLLPLALWMVFLLRKKKIT